MTKYKPGGPVGYANPPAEFQFKKGDPPANPNGRRGKKPRPVPVAPATSTHDLVLRVASSPVKVRDQNGVREITAKEANLQALSKAGAMGDRAAQKLFLQLTMQAEESADAQLARMARVAKEYRHQYSRLIKEQEAGQVFPCYLFHPDDLAFDSARGKYVVNGPLTAEGEQRAQDLAFCLKHLLAGIEDWMDFVNYLTKCWHEREVFTELAASRLQSARIWNSWLPKRLKIDIHAFQQRVGVRKASAADPIVYSIVQPMSPSLKHIIAMNPDARFQFGFRSIPWIGPDPLSLNMTRHALPANGNFVDLIVKREILRRLGADDRKTPARLHRIACDVELPPYVRYNAGIAIADLKVPHLAAKAADNFRQSLELTLDNLPRPEWA